MAYPQIICRHVHETLGCLVGIVEERADGFLVQPIEPHTEILSNSNDAFLAQPEDLIYLAQPEDLEVGMRVRYTYDHEHSSDATVVRLGQYVCTFQFGELLWARQAQLMAYKFWPEGRPEERMSDRLKPRRPAQLSLFT